MFAVLVLAATHACVGEGLPPSSLRTDSAGVSIVLSARPAWGQGQSWRVGEQPRLDLTRSGEGASHEFYRVRDAMRLENGSIVVANAGSSEVRFFDSAGVFLRTVGARGDGPGEFRGPDGVSRYPGDSVAVFDRRHQRVTILDREGGIGRTVTFAVDAPDQLDVKEDGSFLIRTTRLEAMAGVVGRTRIPQDVLAFSPTGELRDTVVTVPGFETFVFERGDARPPLQKESFLFVFSEAVATGSADDMAYEVYSEDGRLRRQVRIPSYPLDVSVELRSSLQEELTQMNAPDFIQEVNRRMAAAIPEKVPAYVDMLGDPDGYLWVALYGRPDEAQRWIVFDSLGAWAGTISLPRGFEAYEIGHDYLLGKGTNVDGTETVEILRLIRE